MDMFAVSLNASREQYRRRGYRISDNSIVSIDLSAAIFRRKIEVKGYFLVTIPKHPRSSGCAALATLPHLRRRTTALIDSGAPSSDPTLFLTWPA